MGTPGDKAEHPELQFAGKKAKVVVRGQQLDPEQQQQLQQPLETETAPPSGVPISQQQQQQRLSEEQPRESYQLHLAQPGTSRSSIGERPQHPELLQIVESKSVEEETGAEPLEQISTEMGLLSRLPEEEFEAFAQGLASAIQPEPGILSHAVGSKPETFQAHETTSTTSGSGSLLGSGLLEQAHMEDYYAQTKFYATASSAESMIGGPSTSSSFYQSQKLLETSQQSSTFLSSFDQPGPSGLQQQQPTSRTRSKLKSGPKKTTAKKPSESSSSAAAAAALLPQQPRKSTTSLHTCSVCQKNFATLEKLSKHQQVHTGTSPFKCEHCKKSFSSKFKLVRHALIHSDRKPFMCTVCERTFHRKDHLKNHIKVHSPSKKVYTCERPDCKKEYTSTMSYRKHLALHAAEEGSLQCQICAGMFKTKEEILYHLKVHAGSRTVKNPSEKKFTCDQCDRKFFTKKDVRRHLVVHTGMRDFLCQFCPQRFGRKDHLVRHIKKSHSKNVPPEDLETAIKTELQAAIASLEQRPSETIVKPELVEIKSEIKTEFPEPQPSTSAAEEEEQFEFSLEDILPRESFEEEFGPYLEPSTSSFLGPSTSRPIEPRSLEERASVSSDIPSYLPAEIMSPERELKEFKELKELKELETSFLEDMARETAESSSEVSARIAPEQESGEIPEIEEILEENDLQRLLLETASGASPAGEDTANLPLPGFQQTFHHQQPQPKPPQPPP